MYKRMQEAKARMKQSTEHERGHRAARKMRGWQWVTENQQKIHLLSEREKQTIWNSDTAITRALDTSKREIKTIFFSIGTPSLIIEVGFLFKRDVCHLSFCSHRQLVPRHGVLWEHLVLFHALGKSTLGSELSLCPIRGDMLLGWDTKCSCLWQIPFSQWNQGWVAPTFWQKLAKGVATMLGQLLWWPWGKKEVAQPLQNPAASQGRASQEGSQQCVQIEQKKRKIWPGLVGELWYLTLLHKHPSQPLWISGTSQESAVNFLYANHMKISVGRQERGGSVVINSQKH